MSHRTWRVLEVLAGPVLPTVLFVPPMLAGILALSRVAGEGDGGPVRAAVGAGLVLGLVAVVGAAPTLLAPCPSLVACPVLGLGLGGPSIVGIRHLIRLIRVAR